MSTGGLATNSTNTTSATSTTTSGTNTTSTTTNNQTSNNSSTTLTTNNNNSTSNNNNNNSTNLSNLIPTVPCSFALNTIRKRKVKFTIQLNIEELLSVPYLNGVLFCKVRLCDGGNHVSYSSKKEVNNSKVLWSSDPVIQFEVKAIQLYTLHSQNTIQSTSPSSTTTNLTQITNSTTNSSIVSTCQSNNNQNQASKYIIIGYEPCLCRISVRKELRGGKSYQKLGYVDYNLADYILKYQQEMNSFNEYCVNRILKEYDTTSKKNQQRLDNSYLKIKISVLDQINSSSSSSSTTTTTSKLSIPRLILNSSNSTTTATTTNNNNNNNNNNNTSGNSNNSSNNANNSTNVSTPTSCTTPIINVSVNKKSSDSSSSSPSGSSSPISPLNDILKEKNDSKVNPIGISTTGVNNFKLNTPEQIKQSTNPVSLNITSTSLTDTGLNTKNQTQTHTRNLSLTSNITSNLGLLSSSSTPNNNNNGSGYMASNISYGHNRSCSNGSIKSNFSFDFIIKNRNNKLIEDIQSTSSTSSFINSGLILSTQSPSNSFSNSTNQKAVSSLSNSSSFLSATGKNSSSLINSSSSTSSIPIIPPGNNNQLSNANSNLTISNSISSNSTTNANTTGNRLEPANLRIIETRIDANEIISEIENELASRLISN